MLSGLKFVPRDQFDKAQGEVSDNSVRDRKKLDSCTEKRMRRKKKTSSYSSSDDEEVERLKKGSKKKKWYSSDECSSSYSSESESESGSSYKLDGKKRRSRKKGRRSKDESSGDEADDRLNKRSRSKRKNQSSDLYSSSASESEGSDDISGKKDRRQRGRKKYELSRSKKRDHAEEIGEDDINDDSRGSQSLNNMDSARKEMGLEWMLSAKNAVRKSLTSDDHEPEELPTDEIKKTNPKELNPYLKDNGSGYPEDEDGRKAGGKELLPSSVVGDGGASWRLKALKRAQEQAAREGRKLEEVVGERWGSLGHLAVSVASGAAAPSRAHLHAIKNRKRGETEDCQTAAENQNKRNSEKHFSRDYLKDISVRHPNMRAPKVHDSLSWGKRRNHTLSAKDATLVSSAVGSLNKFTNDGNFLREFNGQQNGNPDISIGSSLVRSEKLVESKLELSETNKSSGGSLNQDLSANQLAAKALQLRLKGKHEEAQELMKEAENIRANQTAVSESIRPQNDGGTSRYFMPNMSAKQKEDDSDIYLARKIAQNKQYSISGQADDEYDFDDGPRRKNRKKGGSSDRNVNENNIAKRILTQQERCQFCFENPSRPKHLVISIANFTYLMLPQWQPVVPGHCCILPMQHEAATRTVDNNVWEEIRNFKKCLIMMFAEQEKDVVFLETVMGLAQQRRHCLIECIPLPQDIAKEAPLYFKKAIDEAEDEWSQHNAKRLIDTSQKGLRGSIPKDFPYFHVEFGLNRGFVHVIDDEKQFKSSLGLNVIRGMLEVPEEDMHRRRRHELIEAQKKAVASFSCDWEPFDWTKQLN